jgi:hypothetical protein
MKEMTQEQLKQAIAYLLTTVNPKKVNGDRAQAAIKDPELATRFEEFLDGYEVRQPALPTITLEPGDRPFTVDYGMTFDQMIAACRCNWVNSDLTKASFPIKGDGKVEFESKLLGFDKSISSDEVVAIIRSADKACPWEPAQTEHLLAFGAAYPDEQRKYPIIALGSVGKVGGRRCVPYLRRDGSERDLSLYWWGLDWFSHDRFLAVRKKVS